jgi:HSP90 family molecular chaperone
MERTIKAMGQNVPEVKRILQINPNHSLIKGKLGDKKIDENILQYMYDQAFLLE